MNKDFNKLCEDYFYWYMQKFPILSSFNGIKEYDGELDDFSFTAMRKHFDIQREWINKFNSFRDTDLSFDQIIDKELLNYNFNLNRFYEEVFPLKYKKVDAASEISYAVFSVWTKNEPMDYKLDKISQRLSKTDDFIEKFKTHIKSPVTMWIDLAVKSCDSCRQFIKEILNHAESNNYKDIQSFKNIVNKANSSLEKYKIFLNTLFKESNNDFAMGKEAFEEYLKLRKIPYTGDELIELSFMYQHDINEKMHNIALEKGFKNRYEFMRHIRKDHPEDYNEALKYCQDNMERSKNFVYKKGFSEITDIPLDVIETPEYMRQTSPFAALFPAGKFGNSKGVYVLTPPEDPENIKFFNKPDLINTSIHEAYPGHHLQLSKALENPSLIRLLNPAIEFVEGWALYCEETTLDVGYEDTPERRFIMLHDLLWRAVRVQIDVQLSRGEMDYAKAVQTLSEAIDQPLDAVKAEINRYTLKQGYQLSYLVGKHIIMQMREKYFRNLGFSLKRFHDIMLVEGSLPLYLHEKVLDEKLIEKIDENNQNK